MLLLPKTRTLQGKMHVKKGIFKSNINAPLHPNSSKAKVNSVEANNEEDDDNDSGVNNCQVDLAKFLNLNSA